MANKYGLALDSGEFVPADELNPRGEEGACQESKGDCMKIKTSELIDASLDWTVWVAAGGAAAYPKTASGPAFLKLWKGNTAKYVHPSTDWAQGGPIIEREGITISKEEGAWSAYFRDNLFEDDGSEHWSVGPTPLIAALRCYVASKLGDEVDIPDELV